MSVVEFNNQFRIIEKIFHTYFCILVRDNYCGYSIDLDSINENINELFELFFGFEYTTDIFSSENNFTTFLINETHKKNKGFYNEDENKIYLLIGEEEVEKTIEDNKDILDIVYNVKIILENRRIKGKKLIQAS